MSKTVQTAGRNALGKFAPEFAHYNDDVLFGENWNNQDIDVKTRSIITVVALMASGITDSSMKFHLENAKAHGVTQKEIAAIITHVAFYAGWPKGWAVFNLAKEVWNDGEGDLPYEDPAMRAHAKEMVLQSILSAKAILLRFRRVKSASTTSHLNQDAATIGTFIMPKTVAVKLLFALPGAVIIKKKASLRSK